MEKVLRDKCKIPESVRIAKACGDKEALSRLGKIGAAKRAERKPIRDKVEKAKSAAKAAADKKFDALIDEVLAAEHQQVLLAGAHAHAMRNLCAWQD